MKLLEGLGYGSTRSAISPFGTSSTVEEIAMVALEVPEGEKS